MLLSHRKMECAQRIILLYYRQFQKHYVKKLRRISEGPVVRDTISHCLHSIILYVFLCNISHLKKILKRDEE